MTRTLSLRRMPTWMLALAAALLVLPAGAMAHESDWQHDDEEHSEVEGTPVPFPAERSAPVPDSDEWPDPYAHERAFEGFVLSGGLAYFGPWDSDDRGGPGAQISGMYQSPTGRFRIGAELFHRRYETQFFNVESIDIDTYEINLIGHYVLYPGRITPYFGGGLGVHINDIDGRELARKDPTLDVEDDTGAGFGFFGLAGVEIPLSERIALFGEGRIHLSYQEVGEDDFDDRRDRRDDNTVNTGGGSGLIGVRVRF